MTEAENDSCTRASIRAANGGDLDQLTPLVVLEAKHGLRFASHAKLDPDFAWDQLVVQKLQSPRTRVFLAEREARIVGYLELRLARQATSKRLGILQRLRSRVRGKRIGTPIRLPPRAIIEACFVLESVRRNGVASTLLNAALDYAKSLDIGRIELGVMARNTEGRIFWESRGFAAQRVIMARTL